MVISIDLAKKELNDSKHFSFKKYWVERAEQHLETYDIPTLNRLNASDFQCITEKAKSLTQKIDSAINPW
jgi:predicted secreted protein